MSSKDDSTTLDGWRERPPFSHSLKIKNFSQFQKSTLSSDGKYQSRFFSSGGYNWRMVTYPKGNEKDDGIGFISMYVEIDGTSLTSTPPSEVFADLRFFVFNKKENKYFTTQDVESRAFNTLNPIRGLAQVLPLDTFSDPKNGYIFGGNECEFGVDVIVALPPSNLEILSFDDNLTYPKFSWTLKHFSEMKENSYKSSSFSMGGREWSLELYPKGNTVTDDNKWLSIYLRLDDCETLKVDEKIFTRAELRVLDPLGCNHVTKIYEHWFISNGGWGYPRFVSVAEVHKTHLDKEGALTVEVEFEVVSQTKY